MAIQYTPEQVAAAAAEVARLRGQPAAGQSSGTAPAFAPTAPDPLAGASVLPDATSGFLGSPWSTAGLDEAGIPGSPVGTTGVQQTATGAWASNLAAQRDAEQREEAEYEAINADLQAAFDARPQDVQNFKSLAEMAIRGATSDDEEQKAFAQDIMHSLRDVDAFRGVFSSLDNEREFEDFYEAPAEPNLFQRGLAWLGPKLDATSQWGVGMVADLRGGDFDSALSRAGEGAVDLAETAASIGTEVTGLGTIHRISEALGSGGVTKVIMPDYWADKAGSAISAAIPDPQDLSHLDADGDGRIDFLEALRNPDFGEGVGWGPLDLNSAVNLVGEMAVDPLSYATFGAGGVTGRAAKVATDTIDDVIRVKATKLVANGVLTSDDVARGARILADLNSGRKLTDADKPFIRKVLEIGARENPRALKESGEFIRKTARNIDRQVDNAVKRSAGGMFFAGQHIPGSSGPGKVLDAIGLTGQKWSVAEVQHVDGVFRNAVENSPKARFNALDAIDQAQVHIRKITGDRFKDVPDAKLFDSLDGKLKEQYDNALTAYYRNIEETYGNQGQLFADLGLPTALAAPVRDSAGFVSTNPSLAKMRRSVDKHFNTFFRLKPYGPAQQRAMREAAGSVPAIANEAHQTMAMGLKAQQDRAIKQVAGKTGRRGAKRELEQILDRVRSMDPEDYARAIEDLRLTGREEVVKLIDMGNATNAAGLDLRRQLGHRNEFPLFDDAGRPIGQLKLDPRTYTSRQTAKQAAERMNELKVAGGPVWRKLQDLANGNDKPLLDELVRRGVIEANRVEELGDLLAPWFRGSLADLGNDAVDGDKLLHTLLLGQGSAKARTFMPEIKSINEVNRKIGDIFEAIGDEIGEDIGITDFYSPDVVDVWIQNHSSYMDSKAINDILNSYADFDIVDSGTGSRRMAVVKGEHKAMPVYDKKHNLVEGEFTHTYKWLDPKTRRQHTAIGNNQDELVANVRKMIGDRAYDVQVVGPEKLFIVDSNIMTEITETIIPRIKKSYVEGDVMRFIDKWNSVWAAHATVPLVGAAFHARNSVGNWFNMSLAGMKNPGLLVQAAHHQRLNKGVQHHIRRNAFLDWDAAANDLVGKTIRVGGRKVKVTAKEVKTLRMAREHAIVSSSFFTDLKTDRIMFTGGGVRDNFSRTLVDNPFVNSGQALGSTIENNARLALFLDSLDKGMSPGMAAQHVKKFLFDYSDLTPFENEKLRTVSRFYTWIRKNTELQVGLMMQAPGSVWNTQKVVDEIMGNLFGDDGDPRKQGFFLPDWAEDASMMFNAQDTFIHGYETPMTAAFDTLGNVFSLAAVIPGGETLIPEPFRANDLKSQVNNMLGLMASGPTTAVTNIYELASGVDMFTGAQLTDNKYARAMSFIETFIPSIPKAAREVERLGGLDNLTVGGEGQEEWGLVSDHQSNNIGLRLMNLFLGMDIYDLNDEQQSRALVGITASYERLAAELRRDGHEVLTLTELREAGRIAEADALASAILFSADPKRSIDAQLPTGWIEFLAQETGLPREMLVPAEKSIEVLAEEAEVLYEMLEYRLDRKLTPTERWQLGFQMPGVPTNPEMEALGLNPYRENQFISEADSEANIARAQLWLSAMAPVWGMTEQEVLAANPLLSEAQIYMSDALAIGTSPQEAMTQYIGELSRTRRAQLFGVDSLEEFDYEKSMTPEERVSLNRRIWEDAMQYMVIAQFFGMPMTANAAITYVNYGADRLLQGERELLGLPPRQSIPNRKTAQTEDEILREARLTEGQIQDVAGPVGSTYRPGSFAPAPVSLFPSGPTTTANPWTLPTYPE